MQHHYITVLGAGYVGLTTAAILAHSGSRVYVVEPNEKRLSAIKNGHSFFYEAGLDKLIQTALKMQTLIPTNSYAEAIPNSTAVFSCVGTPSNPDGSTNLEYVFAAAEKSQELLRDGTVYIQKSTVPVGTGEKVEKILNKSGKFIPYVSNPEFLRESSAVYDTLFFDRVVVGGNNKDAVNSTLSIYKNVQQHRIKIAKIAQVDTSKKTGRFISTDLSSAELIKVSANAFLAMKISFANSIAKLSDAVGADINNVMDAVGADERIGGAFLNAGRGYGGGCFPKDVSGLIASGREYGINLELIKSTQAVNDSMPQYIIQSLRLQLENNLKGRRITLLGLSFKANTSDTRHSPGILIANQLANEGVIITAYDPKANDEAKEDLSSHVTVARSVEEAMSNPEVVIITTNWSEFTNLSLNQYERSGALLILDAVNSIDKTMFKNSNIKYIGVGR